MPIQVRATLKSWFKKGLKPLETQFADWIDSYWHKNDAIPISSIDNLNNTLNQYVTNTQIININNLLNQLVPISFFGVPVFSVPIPPSLDNTALIEKIVIYADAPTTISIGTDATIQDDVLAPMTLDVGTTVVVIDVYLISVPSLYFFSNDNIQLIGKIYRR
ncbi:MAG: hypothetical protein RLZZ292_647 [Bacteroidota bacterium]|jgi:hypothetical protein